MKIVVVALCGALVGALAMVAVREGRTPAPGPTSADVESVVRKEKASLDDRLAQLSRDFEALRATPAPARLEVTPPPQADLGPLTARIGALEEKVASLVQVKTEQEAATKAFNEEARQRNEARAKGLRECQRIAVDRNAGEKERIAAFKALRDVRMEDGTDARSHDVVVAIVDVAEHSQDEETRLDVYRNMHRAEDPAARDAMLRALTHDSSAKVRSKVAEDLDTWVDDPLVESALRLASESDADNEVRGSALKALAEKLKKKKNQ